MRVPGFLTAALRWPYRRRRLAERIFGVPLLPGRSADHFFDLVTPALVARASSLAPSARVLDLGCGPFAIVGQALARRGNRQVVSADIDPKLAERARESVSYAGSPVEVIESRFFDRLGDREFDLICFNPPYVPVQVGEAFGLPDSRRSQWAAGEDGLDVVRAFLEALSKLPYPTTALLAVNRWFAKEAPIRSAVSAHPELGHTTCFHSRLLPADVHQIGHRPSA